MEQILGVDVSHGLTKLLLRNLHSHTCASSSSKEVLADYKTTATTPTVITLYGLYGCSLAKLHSGTYSGGADLVF